MGLLSIALGNTTYMVSSNSETFSLIPQGAAYTPGEGAGTALHCELCCSAWDQDLHNAIRCYEVRWRGIHMLGSVTTTSQAPELTRVPPTPSKPTLVLIYL